MKKYFKYSALAIMAMMAMCMFTACGGDDKDEDLPDGYQKTTEGVRLGSQVRLCGCLR